MCTDLFRSRRKIICGGVGGWWRSRAAKLHERSLPIHLAVPFLAVLGGVALAGDPAPVIQNGMPTTVVPVFQEPGAPQFSYPAGSTALGSGTGGGTGERVTRAGAGEGEPYQRTRLWTRSHSKITSKRRQPRRGFRRQRWLRLVWRRATVRISGRGRGVRRRVSFR